MNSHLIRVLVVDDSAFARKVIREVLSKDSDIEIVGIARDGLEAIEKINELKPDVVTLDLVMPDLDGLGVLRALPLKDPPKVVIVSVSGSDTDIAIEALSIGAFDMVSKPTPLPTDRLYELSDELVRKVKLAAASRARPQVGVTEVPAPLIAVPALKASAELVVIGTSTGGPQALSELFKFLPVGLPVPFAIALHIPAGYTAALAERLTKLGGIKIHEAYDGLELKAGEGVLAAGGKHLRVRVEGGKTFAVVSYEPSTTLHHPSVDILFESAAEHFGAGALGVILTGMGSDGTEGAKKIKAAGGRVLAESESSCVVYGMPRSVVEAGAATAEATLVAMPGLITKYIYRAL